MKKILKPGVIPPPTIYRCTCQRCGCVFEASAGEMLHNERAGSVTFTVTVHCATCGFLVHPTNITTHKE